MLLKNGSGGVVDKTMYRQLIGSLMYLTASRPDIQFAVSYVSRFMENPSGDHLFAAKRILRYLQGTKDFGLFFMKKSMSALVAYSDSDFAGCKDDRRSTSGYAFILGGAAVSWMSRKQQIVTLSSTEAEYVAATECAKHILWMRRVLEFLHFPQKTATKLLCDNSSTLKLAKNPVLHGRTKHIDVKFFFLRDLCDGIDIEIDKCRSEDNYADIFTKPLKIAAFEYLRTHLGVCNVVN